MPHVRNDRGKTAGGGLFRRDFEKELAAISADNRTGAVSLARRAALALARLSEDPSLDEVQRFRAALSAGAAAFLDSQPAMAPMVHLANGVLFTLDAEVSLPALRRRTRRFCIQFAARLEQNTRRIAAHAARAMPRRAVVLVHSSSRTVRDTLVHAARNGKLQAVLCTESRPMREGVDFARDLAAAGVKVTLIVDAAAGLHMPAVDLVMVGADSIMPEGVVNKIGTTLLALAAHSCHKPFWVLCDCAKFRAPGSMPPPERSHDPAEVASLDTASIDVENYYFERTPMKLVSAVITEKGVLSASQARALCRKLHNHSRLSASI